MINQKNNSSRLLITCFFVSFYFFTLHAQSKNEIDSLNELNNFLSFKEAETTKVLKLKNKDYDIQKIEYYRSGAWRAPSSNLIINADKTISYEIHLINDRKEMYKSIIDSVNYKKIIDNLIDLDFPSLKDEYPAFATCTSSCILKVTYNDGQVKTINDRGEYGIMYLFNFYTLLMEFTQKHKWR